MKKKNKATGVLVNIKSLKDDQIDEALDKALDALFGEEEEKPEKKAGSTKRKSPGRKKSSGKYAPLEQYLRELPATQREVTLGFDQIEGILKSKLPSSAYEYRQWWENEKEGNHVNARAWANAGWKVENVDFNRKQARLVRV